MIAFAFAFTSCGVNSNLMWKQAKGTEVNSDSIPLSPQEDYQLSVDDKITFTLSTNNGANIIERMSGIDQTMNRDREREYVIRRDGTVELPKVGKVPVVGLTVEQCEDTLVSRFSTEYQEPFIQVRVTNQRVIVFPGNGSDAKVIPLMNTNTTLMEAIAQAGGITDRGKANTVKLMRKVNGERVVYVMDLSVIEGLKFADMIVQANDYIYIEPTPEIGREIANDVVPIFSLITSAIVIFTFINSF
jgi:polysaccharide export outer membrane protein